MDRYRQLVEDFRNNSVPADDPGPQSSWSCPALQDHIEFIANGYKTKTDKPLINYFTDILHRSMVGFESKGDKLYNEIMISLSKSKFNKESTKGRTEFQQQLHSAMIEAILPKIYGREWDDNPHMVLKKRALKKLEQAVLVSTPRRYGKTQGVSMFLAVALTHLKNFRVVLFGQNTRTTREIMNYTRAYMSRIEGRGKIVRDSSSSSIIELWWSQKGTLDDPERSELIVLPSGTSGADNLRGQGFDLAIIEEAVFVKRNTYTVGVAPGLQKFWSALVAISSASPNIEHFFNKWMEKVSTKTGDKLFRTIKIELKCKECREKKLSECVHTKPDKPFWLDPDREELINAMYDADPQLRDSEILGISSETFLKVVETAMLRTAFDQSKWVNPIGFVPFGFIYVDPSGMGKTSNTGIASCVVTNDNTLVVSF